MAAYWLETQHKELNVTCMKLTFPLLDAVSALILIILLNQMHTKHAKRTNRAQKATDPIGIATYSQKEVPESSPESSVPGDSVGNCIVLERVKL